MEVGIIISIIFLALLIICNLVESIISEPDNKYSKALPPFNIIIIIICIILLRCTMIRYHKNPKAIDVYRGNTTLEITYKNDTPIDSVVVFK